MKKVKVMLTAIAILTVVGGALAFKAKTFNSTVWTTSDGTVTNPKCPIETPNTTITNVGTAISVTIVAPTDAAGEPCVASATKAQN